MSNAEARPILPPHQTYADVTDQLAGILEQRYGTGLEDQVTGLHESGEEYADPNGWRNNAKGAVRLVPTSNRQLAADIPKPGVAPPPSKLLFRSSAKDRDY